MSRAKAWLRAGLVSGLALLAFSPTALAANRSTAAYVVDNSENQILQYTVADNGTLTPDTPATVATGLAPTSIALSPDGKSAYVANEFSAETGPAYRSTISQYNVAPNGTLTPKDPATVQLPENYPDTGFFPEWITVNPNGRNVYVATDDGNSGNGFTNEIYQFNVGANGKLSPMTPAVVDVGPGQPNGTGQLQGMVESSDGRSVYFLAAGTSIGGSGNVYQFSVSANGALEPKTPSMVATGPVPTAITLGAYGKSAYVVNSDAGSYDRGVGSISEYTVAANGTLAPQGTVKLATSIYDPNAFPQNIAVSPYGNSAIVLTGGGNVDQLAIAPTGLLSSTPVVEAIPTFPLDAGAPIAAAYNANGNFAYVTNQGGGFVAGSGYPVGSDGPSVVSQYRAGTVGPVSLNSPSEVLTGAPYVTAAFPSEVVLNRP